VRFSIDNPSAEVEVRSVLRAARSASSEHLADTAARARKLATLHCAWPAWLAAAIADRRQRRWVAARGALDLALELAPGAPAVHWEMSEVLLEMHEAAGAVAHAERAVALAGEGATALAMLARALLGAGREAEARVMAARALAKGPPSKAVKRILTPLTTPARRPPGWVERMKAAFRRWRGN